MEILFWTLAGYLCGSIPFSVAIGRLVGRLDIRQYGDHNPGATNVLRAMGWQWGGLAFLLDFLKGAIPVGIAWFFVGLQGWSVVPVALSPVVGHAYSPWLRFRGGKAVATTFGIWSGLTVGTGPILLGMLLVVFYSVFRSSGWAVILAMISFGVFMWLYFGEVHPEFIWVWLGNFGLLILKHRQELSSMPAFRSGVFRIFRRL